MNQRGVSVAGVVLSLALGGCVVEQRDFEALRDQVRLQQKQINDLKARQDEQSLRVDTLNNGFKILGDKAEENARRIDEMGERETAPPPVAAQAAAAPASVPAPVALPQEQPVPPAPAPEPLSSGPVLLTNLPKAVAPEKPAGGEIITAAPKADKLYAAALTLYSSRDYPQAAAKFEEFVATHPENKLAGNAQYWIGECLYSQRRFADAEEAFSLVEKTYPASPKVPASLYKRGLSLAEVKRWSDARAVLQRIVEKYPQSEEAAKAREKLDRWKQQ